MTGSLVMNERTGGEGARPVKGTRGEGKSQREREVLHSGEREGWGRGLLVKVETGGEKKRWWRRGIKIASKEECCWW